MDWFHFGLFVIPLVLQTLTHIVHANIIAHGKPDHGTVVDNLSDYAQVISGIVNSSSPPQVATAPDAGSTP